MNGTIDLTDPATQIGVVIAIVAALRFPLSRLIPAAWMDWVLLALNCALQVVLVFAVTLLASSEPVTGQRVLAALGAALMAKVRGQGAHIGGV